MDNTLVIPSINREPNKGFLNFGGATLNAGQCIGIAGRNGAGKSVLLRSILDICKGGIGWVSNFREPFLDLRVQEVLEIANTTNSPLKVSEIMKQFSLESLSFHAVQVLSDGEFMRLMLARVTIQDPQLLLLDEPDAHLDFYFKEELKKTVFNWKENGKIILFSTHDENLLKMADDIWWVESGIVQSTDPKDFHFQKNTNSDIENS